MKIRHKAIAWLQHFERHFHTDPFGTIDISGILEIAIVNPGATKLRNMVTHGLSASDAKPNEAPVPFRPLEKYISAMIRGFSIPLTTPLSSSIH